jgi:hypothetical protein
MATSLSDVADQAIKDKVAALMNGDTGKGALPFLICSRSVPFQVSGHGHSGHTIGAKWHQIHLYQVVVNDSFIGTRSDFLYPML